MPNLSFRLSLATLIPDFIYQFLSNEFIDNNIFTCFELEDVRNSVLNLKYKELENIEKFLMIEKKGDNKKNTSQEILDKLDAEFNEIDNEYYHRYTPGELKYIFGEILNNIDIIYDAYKKEFETNMILTINFKFKDGLESNMIIEFLNINETPDYLDDVFFLPMDNYFVSDNIIVRVYFYNDKKKQNKYEYFFDKIFKIISLNSSKNNDLLN